MAVNDDGGFVLRFPNLSDAVAVSGAGIRLTWFPDKAAFRAGSVDAGHWDASYVGAVSVALGKNTIASGVGSTALGNATTASGNTSTALRDWGLR